MLRRIISILTLLIGVTSATAQEGPLLYCDTLSHNFGIVDRCVEEVSYTFNLENRGDEPLIIKRVERSCSCMKVSLSRRPIEVGEVRPMRVTYEVRKMPLGLFSKVVQIYSTSRDEGFEQFTLTGRSVSEERKRDYKRELKGK